MNKNQLLFLCLLAITQLVQAMAPYFVSVTEPGLAEFFWNCHKTIPAILLGNEDRSVVFFRTQLPDAYFLGVRCEGQPQKYELYTVDETTGQLTKFTERFTQNAGELMPQYSRCFNDLFPPKSTEKYVLQDYEYTTNDGQMIKGPLPVIKTADGAYQSVITGITIPTDATPIQLIEKLPEPPVDDTTPPEQTQPSIDVLLQTQETTSLDHSRTPAPQEEAPKRITLPTYGAGVATGLSTLLTIKFIKDIVELNNKINRTSNKEHKKKLQGDRNLLITKGSAAGITTAALLFLTRYFYHKK